MFPLSCFLFLHISFQFLRMHNRLASARFVKNRPGSPLGRLLAERMAAFHSRGNLALFSSDKMGGSMDLYILYIGPWVEMFCVVQCAPVVDKKSGIVGNVCPSLAFPRETETNQNIEEGCNSVLAVHVNVGERGGE